MRIACCSRDHFLAAKLARLMARERFECEVFRDESDLMRVLRHCSGIDLALIDVGRDATVTESVLSWLGCRSGNGLPVLLLAAEWQAQSVAMALDAGADDCIAKPFDDVELMARVKAALRRSRSGDPASSGIEVAGFVLDCSNLSFVDRGVAVELAPREFALAWLFFSNPGQVMVREAISLAIWDTGKEVASRTIEQHVYRLRKKIGLDATRGVIIRASYGHGYRLDVCEDRWRRAPAPLPAGRLTQLDVQRISALP
jgi:DNA-binding response OmpR family regulator